MPKELMQAFEAIVDRRQTNKIFDGSPIEKELIEKLLDWAYLAPNHRLNEPWRFSIFGAGKIPLLIDRFRAQLTSEEAQSFEKAFSRLSKAGAMIYVTVASDDNPIIHAENFSAASAAVEHILLGAASMELSSFWSSNKAMRHPELRRLLKVDETDQFVASIWLGRSDVKPKRPPRKRSREFTQWHW